jgi:Methylase involved in ubiquinone/menaquinone biosynthesis
MLAKSIDYKLPEKEKKSEYVESKFDEIAQRYDLFNDLITFGMHRYWKNSLLRKPIWLQAKTV